ncbi:MAG: HipA domain-containing protein [Coriobacteriaceae bacterium]|nr:HipA domain-containing protein [Coriobacteriaceae bacterium]
MASAELIELQPGNTAICVERFDRQISKDANKKLTVLRRHQEDFSQALRLSSGSKYAELEPSSAKVIAELLKQHSARPLNDIRTFAHITLFNYLIGNCDNHLKNFSLIHEGQWVRLSPAYDLVPTTIFPRFSREMSMNIGAHRNIDEINSRDFSLFANELSISPNLLRKLAKKMIHTLPSAIMVEAYKQEALGFETLPYDAKDLVDNLQTRLHVLESFVEG